MLKQSEIMLRVILHHRSFLIARISAYTYSPTHPHTHNGETRKKNGTVLSFPNMTTSLFGQSICQRAHGLQIISAVALSTVASGVSDKQEALAGAFHLHVN